MLSALLAAILALFGMHPSEASGVISTVAPRASALHSTLVARPDEGSGVISTIKGSRTAKPSEASGVIST